MNKPLPNIAIVGMSGSGKSTSIRNLPPEQTLILNVERKALPFFNAEAFTHYLEPASTAWKPILEMIKTAEAEAVKRGCKYIVLDSLNKALEHCHEWCKTAKQGYDIYSTYTTEARQVINTVKSSKVVWIVLAIDDLIEQETPEGGKKCYRMMGCHGKELSGKIDREFVVVAFTTLVPTKGGVMEHKFLIAPDGVTTARCPMGAFDPDKERLIPNDVKLILERLKVV